jgi:hypothetical protein
MGAGRTSDQHSEQVGVLCGLGLEEVESKGRVGIRMQRTLGYHSLGSVCGQGRI